MAKRKNNKLITILLILVLLATLGIGFYLTIPFIKNTNIYKNYQANRLVTYTSTRAKFSFKYPNSWPLSVIPEERLKRDNAWRIQIKDNFQEIESIDFQEEWIPNAGGPRYGWIDVTRIDGINSLDDYVKSINKETEIYCPRSPKGVCIIPAPEIGRTTIGGEKAISVKDKDTLASFSINISEYVAVKNGWVYRFAAVDSSRFLENKEANLAKFQKIIESVRFMSE